MRVLLQTSWSEPDAELAAKSAAAEDLEKQWDAFNRIISGQAAQPAAEESFFEKGDYEEFSLARVSLGYGIPTLIALMLSAALFCWRDL